MAEEFTIVTVAADPERFEELAADHARWRQVASNLVAAAELLWPASKNHFARLSQAKATAVPVGSIRAPFYLLMGLAVENLAKAIIVRQKQLRSEGMTKGDVLAFGGTRRSCCLRSDGRCRFERRGDSTYRLDCRVSSSGRVAALSRSGARTLSKATSPAQRI